MQMLYCRLRALLLKVRIMHRVKRMREDRERQASLRTLTLDRRLEDGRAQIQTRVEEIDDEHTTTNNKRQGKMTQDRHMHQIQNQHAQIKEDPHIGMHC